MVPQSWNFLKRSVHNISVNLLTDIEHKLVGSKKWKPVFLLPRVGHWAMTFLQ